MDQCVPPSASAWISSFAPSTSSVAQKICYCYRLLLCGKLFTFML